MPSKNISACIIAYNEEEFLSDCLQSVRELCSEIIVCVDDRTTDDTAKIAEAFGATVSYFKWEDDFSAARNAALELVTGDWVIVIDADERLAPIGATNLRKVIDSEQYDIIWLMVQSQTKVGSSMNWSVRVWRKGFIHYNGIVHNQPVHKEGARDVRATIELFHLGYGLPPEEQALKTDRTIKLLLKDIEQRPDSMFAKSNLIRSYRTIDEWDKLRDIAMEVKLMPEESYLENAYIMSMIDLMYSYIQVGEFRAATEIGHEILEIAPDYIDALMYMGHACIELKNWEESIKWYSRYIEAATSQGEKPRAHNLTMDTMGSVHQAYNNVGAAYMQIDQPDKAATYFEKAMALMPDIATYQRGYIAALKKERVSLLAANNTLRILFIQPSACARNIKQATALQSLGHRVTLAYQVETSRRYGMDDSMYHDIIKLPHQAPMHALGEYLAKIAQNFDVFHIHNEPDVFTMIAAGAVGGRIPIVHDTHDIVSLRGRQPYAIKYYEGFAHNYADGLIFVSDYQRDQARNIYNRLDVPTLTLWNAIAESNVPTKLLPKLSEQDGEVHLVYEGGAGTYGYRDYRSIFSDIAHAGIHVHIHPSFVDEAYTNMAAGNDYIHYYDPLPPKELMVELTQYDAGLIPLAVDDSNRECANASMPNKLFEYLAAGLPIIARRLVALTDFIEKHSCGMTYEDAPEIVALKEEWTLPVIFMPPITMESQIGRLVEFYKSLQDHPSTFGIHSFDHEGSGS